MFFSIIINNIIPVNPDFSGSIPAFQHSSSDIPQHFPHILPAFFFLPSRRAQEHQQQFILCVVVYLLLSFVAVVFASLLS